MKRAALLMAALLAQLQAGAADQVTGDDLVYTEAWGTQSACSYCSYVKGQVIEKPLEVLGLRGVGCGFGAACFGSGSC
jgi:hypothetical protein